MSSYRINPLQLGVEVFGIDLNQDISLELVEKIKKDLWKYRILVFRNQGDISGDRQVEIAKWFGQLDSEPFYKHPKSPANDVFRVSNDESEGCRGVGRTGWHIDGSFRQCPYCVSVYYMPVVPKQGDTRFVGLREVINSISDEQRNCWDRLWMINDRRSGIIHPLIYPHPITKEITLCFHLGMTEGFISDMGLENELVTSDMESINILRDIHKAIVDHNEKLVYSHKWKPGDFILSDNLAIGHEASPESQLPVAEVGLRVLHRVTVAGVHKPEK